MTLAMSRDPSRMPYVLHGVIFRDKSAGWYPRIFTHARLLFLLTLMHRRYILMHMRTTLNIETTLIEEAARLTGVTEKTALVRMGLAALIAREGARRLADLGGTEKNLRRPPRRRSVRAA